MMSNIEQIIGACLFCLTVVVVNIAIHIKTNENVKTRIEILETWLSMLSRQFDSLEQKLKSVEKKNEKRNYFGGKIDKK